MNHIPRHKKNARIAIAIDVLTELFPRVTTALHYTHPWELLFAVIMSAQCTDARVNIVTKKLFHKYRSLTDYVRADPEEFARDIFSTGFYRSKTKHILAAAARIYSDFYGEVPRTMEELTSLPGVARKTANVVLSELYDIRVGIAVDTHVMRLTRKYGMTDGNTPESIEQDLMRSVPRSCWRTFSLQLVEYGRKYCPARTHDHASCPISVALMQSQLAPTVQDQ